MKRALSLFQSILLSFGQSINHDNALNISNYYINITYYLSCLQKLTVFTCIGVNTSGVRGFVDIIML
jgi:hypothetical protein